MAKPGDKTSLNQRIAADPQKSAWVSANAGSGKTHVLVNRIISLMLEGAQPGKILALTFTKAAAAEMANRLNTRLAAWAMLSRDELIDDITDITGTPPPPAQVLGAGNTGRVENSNHPCVLRAHSASLCPGSRCGPQFRNPR